MVSYGDSNFLQWADENGFNDQDLLLIKKTVTRRKRVLLLVFLLIAGAPVALLLNIEKSPELVSTWGETLSVVAAFYFLFSLPFYIECSVLQNIVKQGTFNIKSGTVTNILCCIMYLTFIYIFPIFLWRGAKKKYRGTGLNKLLKKGLIGGH